ncbi:hypothetical protein BDV93DRAFT_540261 [Ceratobasidium sp. AG-I]|nr:hypothetical protein BDV93DRAFT_540261 [Ceratobasidium sp. AG-I]
MDHNKPDVAGHNMLTAVRIHKRQSDESIPFDPMPVSATVQHALEYSAGVILAVSLPPADIHSLLVALPTEATLLDDSHDGTINNTTRVYVLPFSSATYGRFIPALNAIVAFAHERGFEKVLFQSVEVRVGTEDVRRMVELWDTDVLVAGKAFDAHTFHSPKPGCPSSPVYLTGLNCPWNTFAIWDVPKLAKTGFLLTSETHTPPNSSAIEEAPTIALHQRLFPSRARALLVRFRPTAQTEEEDAGNDRGGWGASWTDPARTEWHTRKLASKNTSAAAHISNLGLSGSPTIVEHVEVA